jgi:hypothetical protein
MTDTSATTEAAIPDPADEEALAELAEFLVDALVDTSGDAAVLMSIGDNPASELRPVVQALLAERHSQILLRRFEEETSIRAMEYRNGASMELDAAREMTAIWVGCARGMLGGSTNYSETAFEFTVKAAEDRDKYTLTVQRHAPDALTPHQARQKAEEQLTAVRQAVAEYVYSVNSGDDLDPDDLMGTLDELGYSLAPELDAIQEREEPADDDA